MNAPKPPPVVPVSRARALIIQEMPDNSSEIWKIMVMIAELCLNLNLQLLAMLIEKLTWLKNTNGLKLFKPI